MTTPIAPVPTREPERGELPFPPGPVEELFRLVVKAARAHQLYLPNNPIYRGAIDAVRAAFGGVWHNTEELVVTFTERDIRWCDYPVVEEPTKSADSLPWLFYKDGVRELRLLKGLEDEELVKLLDIVQRARKSSADEDDLLTLLWEADFVFLRYRYVDLALEPAAPLADGGEPRTVEPGEIRNAAESAVQESRAGAIVNMADFDSTLYFLDEKEIEYLQDEVRREYQHDLRSNVISILFDIFEQQTDKDVRNEVLEHLETVMVYLLAAAHFRGVAYLLRESQSAGQRASALTPDQRERLSQLPVRLSAPDALAQLLQALDEALELPPQDDLLELFEQLRPAALATIFAWIGRLQSQRLKGLLEQAASRLASAATAELVRLILSAEREVAIEAIRRSGALKTQAAVGPLSKVMGLPDVELRQLAVSALTEIASPGALQALERGAEDTDREVRIATVRALAARSYRPVLAKLDGIVKGKSIRDADLTEKMAVFEAFGSLCGDAGIAHLDALLNGKGFLGRRDDAEIRACAAIALGRIGSERAMDVLRKASTEKDVVVRNAVNRALRGATT